MEADLAELAADLLDCEPTLRPTPADLALLDAPAFSHTARQSWPPVRQSPSPSPLPLDLDDGVTSRPPPSPHSPPQQLKKGRVSLRTVIKQRQMQEKLEKARAFALEDFTNDSNNVNGDPGRAPPTIAISPSPVNQMPSIHSQKSFSLPDLSQPTPSYTMLNLPPGSWISQDLPLDPQAFRGRLRAPSGCSSVASSVHSSPASSVDLDDGLSRRRSGFEDELLTELFGDGSVLNDGVASNDVEMREKRDKHNYVEKKRRQTLAKQIEELERLLPKRKSFEPRQTKNAVLKSAVDYIKNLRKEKEDAKKEEAKQKETAEYYEKLCKELMIKLKSVEQ